MAASTITLDEAIARSMKNNPLLKAFGYQVEVQKGAVLQSGLKLNPKLNVRVENAFGTGGYSGLDRTETTLSMAWVLERGKREGRSEVAQSGLSVLEIEAEIRRLDTAAQTARLFLESLGHQERLKKVQDAVLLAEQTVTTLKKRVQAGKAPNADLARAEAELSRIRLDREDINHELSVANRKLAAQWGENVPDFQNVLGNALKLPESPKFTDLISLIDKNPDILRYTSEQYLRESELRLAETRTKPNWYVTAGIRRFEESNDHALVADITIPLSIHERNKGNIAKARANQLFTDANLIAKRIAIETQLFALHQELEHSLHKAEGFREEIIPRTQSALVDTQKAYAIGRYGYFELKVVQEELVEAQMELIETSINAHRKFIEIERLIGSTVTSPVTKP